MPRRDFKTPFAVSGDQTQIPTDIQPNGAVSIIQGYGPDYQRPTDGSDPLAKTIERDKFNSLMNEVTASLGEIQQNGSAIWSSGMSPYPINARVRHKDVNWISVISNNTSTPGDNSDWANAESPSGTLIRSVTYSTPGSFTYTPSTLAKKVKVTLVGGGGAGGGTAATASSRAAMGQAGSSGSIACGIFDVNFTTISVQVGSGGVGTSGGSGAAGSNSAFGTRMTAPGGVGGNANNNLTGAYWVSPAVAGGTPTGANVFGAAGNPGTSGQVLLVNTGGPGTGGASSLGGTIGSGGAGTFNVPNQGARTGLSGGAGIAIIEEYT